MDYPLPNLAISLEERVQLTLSCKDCAPIPKVRDAGKIVSENGRQIQIMHNGIKVVAGGYYGKFISDIISGSRGHHEPQEELVFHHILKFIRPNATMIELGGFWSYYSLWFLQDGKRRRWPFGSHKSSARRSIVVEPDPNNIAVGRENAALNGAEIEFVQASAGDSFIPEQSFPSESAGDIVIPQVSVPELLGQKSIEHLDILHCDTQGAETPVVSSLQEAVKSGKISFCVISTHSHHISGDPLTHQRCLSMLKDYGGRILAEHDVHESFSGDGLIAAYFGKDNIDWPDIRMSYARYSQSFFRNPLYDLEELRRMEKGRNVA